MNFEIDGTIIKNAAAGDITCFEKIVSLYEKTIYNICYRYFNNEEDAKDIAQETFIKIFRNLKQYNFSCKFSTWAYKIAVNSCIDSLRKKKARPQTEEYTENIYNVKATSQNPEEAVITKDMYKNIASAINKLPPDYKTVVILRDINGFSYQEIGEITGLNSGTVKSRISRARLALRSILINDNWETERRYTDE